jgi:hypothetical protein
MGAALETALFEAAFADPANGAVLARLRELALPQGFLTAGCLFQAVWNRVAGHPPGWGVKDYDVFYYDAGDLSFAAEDAVIRRCAEAFAGLGVTVEVRNQARVHLWYRDRFDEDYPALVSARDGIDRYLIDGTCIGIEAASGALYAPGGLEDVFSGVLRINPRHPQPAQFLRKAEDYRRRWPHLRIEA